MSTNIRRALYGKLAGDTTLNGLLASPPSSYAKSIFYQQAPPKAAYPFVVFSKVSGIPTETFGDPTALQTDVWQIKGIDHATSADAVEAISDRLVALLNDASLSISGATRLYLRRESDVDYSEIADGETFLHSGALYRLVIEPT
jgi:Protein of unknown function (DUF3168)